MKLLSTLFALAVGLSATAHAGSVAVVDLNKVAQELNYLDYIGSTLETSSASLNQTVEQFQKELQTTLNEAASKLGTAPSLEQQNRFKTFSIELNSQYDQKVNQARQAFALERNKLVREFEDAIKPITLAEAKKKNCDVVLNTVITPIFAFDPAADITQAVIDAAKGKGLAKPASPKPAAPAAAAPKADEGKAKEGKKGFFSR